MADDEQAPKSSRLELTETGIARFEGRELVNVGPLVQAITFLTEGRDREHPEVAILAFDVIQSIITGSRLKHFAKVAEASANASPYRHVLAMQHIWRVGRGPNEFDPPLPQAPAEVVAGGLRTMLGTVDPGVRKAKRKPFIAAVNEVRAASSDEELPRIAADLALSTGLLGHKKRAREDWAEALDRVRKSFSAALRRV
jgi:hypothetical protein